MSTFAVLYLCHAVSVIFCPHYDCVYVFAIEEEVTWESLMCMKDDTLRDIVPKAGPRALLLKRIEEV